MMETNSFSSSPGAQASSIPPATGSSKINVGSAERIVSIIGGLALSIYAIRRMNSTRGKIVGLIGTVLLKRGVTGYCEINYALGRNAALRKADAVEAIATFTVNRPRREIYEFWRNFENLPAFMEHLDRVKVIDQYRSKWTAKLPGGFGTVSWEARVDEEVEDSLISWISLPGSTIDNAGEVRFADAAGQGTEVTAQISYRLPAGQLGSMAGRWLNPVIEGMIRNDLTRYKEHIEKEASGPTSQIGSGAINYNQ
jgi:uncharacterized membrane protein